MFNLQELIQLIPIAVIISIIVFLVRFFGKAISDQVPFTDNRKWQEELSGIIFFSKNILSPFILIGIIYLRGFNFLQFPKEDWLILLIGLIVFISLNISNSKLLSFFTDIKFTDGSNLKSLIESFKNNSKIDFGESMIYYRYLFFPFASFTIIYLSILFYKWGSFYHLLISLLYLFFHLTSFAIFTSLLKRNILIANIKFIDKNTKSINKCRVLKINEDNIRINTGKDVAIINKSLIFKIDVINKK